MGGICAGWACSARCLTERDKRRTVTRLMLEKERSNQFRWVDEVYILNQTQRDTRRLMSHIACLGPARRRDELGKHTASDDGDDWMKRQRT